MQGFQPISNLSAHVFGRFDLSGRCKKSGKACKAPNRLISKAIIIRDLLTDSGNRVLEAGSASKVVRGKHAYDDIVLLALEDSDVIADIRQEIAGFCGTLKPVTYFGSRVRYTWPRIICSIESLAPLPTACPVFIFSSNLPMSRADDKPNGCLPSRWKSAGLGAARNASNQALAGAVARVCISP